MDYIIHGETMPRIIRTCNEDDYRTAIHEAAHGVAAHELGFNLYVLEIYPGKRKGRCIYTREGDTTCPSWANLEALVLRVGSLAESQLLKVKHFSGDQGDMDHITRLIACIYKPLS